MAYTQSDYSRERAICDTANAYWQAHATHGKRGSSMTAELAAAPEYAACDNAMRGRVEQFELLRDLPDRFCAYLESGKSDGAGARLNVTVWTGESIGQAWVYTIARRGNQWGEKQRFGRARIGGKLYAWRGAGAGMLAYFEAIREQS